MHTSQRLFVERTHVLRAISCLIAVCAANRATATSPPTVDAGQIVVAGLRWYTDYMDAYRQARREQRMLLINFVDTDADGNLTDTQRSLEQTIDGDTSLLSRLQKTVLLRLSPAAEIAVDGDSVRLLAQGAFVEMRGQPGIAVLDLAHPGQPYFGHVVSAFPFTSGKYYRWRPEYLQTIVSLPPGSITQRTMVWAVRVHPESPASTDGQLSPELTTAAESHCRHQARIQRQGHHDWGVRYHEIRASVGAADAREIVAESWPKQTMLDSCLDCVASWRHSSGHWGAVRRRHRLFGYDIRRGRNGIWYGTGIFAD